VKHALERIPKGHPIQALVELTSGFSGEKVKEVVQKL